MAGIRFLDFDLRFERFQPGYQDVEAMLAQARHTLTIRRAAE